MDTLDLLLRERHRRSRKKSKESFKVGHRLVETSKGKKSKESFKVGRRLIEIIKSLMSSGVTR